MKLPYKLTGWNVSNFHFRSFVQFPQRCRIFTNEEYTGFFALFCIKLNLFLYIFVQITKIANLFYEFC